MLKWTQVRDNIQHTARWTNEKDIHERTKRRNLTTVLVRKISDRYIYEYRSCQEYPLQMDSRSATQEKQAWRSNAGKIFYRSSSLQLPQMRWWAILPISRAKRWNTIFASSLTCLHARWLPVLFPRATERAWRKAPWQKHLDKSRWGAASERGADFPQRSRNELYGADICWLLQGVWTDAIALSKKHTLRQLGHGSLFQDTQSGRALSSQLPFRARIQRTCRGIHRILQQQTPSSDQSLSNSRCDGGILL